MIPSIRADRRSVSTSARPAPGPSPSSGGGSHRPAGGDHRLRRDAVPQVGGAADDVAFDHGDLGTEPGGVGGRGVPGRPAADDQETRRHERPGYGLGTGQYAWPASRSAPSQTRTPHGRRAAPTARGLAAGSGPAERARVDQLRAQGREPYPYRFERTHTIAEVRAAVGRASSPARRPTDEVTVAGRLLLKRDTGKLVFLTIPDRGVELQLFVSQAVIGDDGLRRGQGARPRRLGRRPRHRHGDPRRRAVGQGRPAGAAGQSHPPPARQVARAGRPRHPLPPALRRPRRQRRGPAGVRGAPRRHRQLPPHVARARASSRSRRPCSRRGRRRPRPPVRHAPQHARHADVPAHRPRAAPQAADRRRHGPGVRDRSRVPQRGAVATAQPRVHDVESLRGVRRRRRRDGADRGPDPHRRRATPSARTTVEIRGQTVDLADPWPRQRMVDLVGEAIGAGGPPGAAGRRPAHASPPTTASPSKPAWGPGQLSRSCSRRSSSRASSAPCSSPGTRSRSRRWPGSTAHDPLLTDRFELFIDAREIANGYSELNDPVEQRLRFEEEQRATDAGDVERGTRRRGLPAGPGVRHAADGRARRRHRPPGHAAGRGRHDPRRHPLPRRCAAGEFRS